MPVPSQDPSAVIAAVMSSTGSDVYGCVPMESSTNGVIRGVFEALLNGAGVVSICAEFAESDELCLCAAAGVTKQNAESVHCHPQLLESCANFLTSLDVGRDEAGTSCRCIPPATGWLAPNPRAFLLCFANTNARTSPDSLDSE